MSVQPVSDCLFLSSFCSFQERGQRLWRGRKKISESKRACDISGPVSGLYYAVIKCVFHSDYSSRFCWPDVVRTALQLIFLYVSSPVTQYIWCVIYSGVPGGFFSHLRDIPQGRSPLQSDSGLPNETPQNAPIRFCQSQCTQGSGLVSHPSPNCYETLC